LTKQNQQKLKNIQQQVAVQQNSPSFVVFGQFKEEQWFWTD